MWYLVPFLALNALLLLLVGGRSMLCGYCSTSHISCCNVDFLDLMQAPQQYFSWFFKWQYVYFWQVQLASMSTNQSSFISRPCPLFTFFKGMFIDLIFWIYIFEMWAIWYLTRFPFQVLKVSMVVHYVYFFDNFM